MMIGLTDLMPKRHPDFPKLLRARTTDGMASVATAGANSLNDLCAD